VIQLEKSEQSSSVCLLSMALVGTLLALIPLISGKQLSKDLEYSVLYTGQCLKSL